ncbi:MAG: alpha/beta hydrolase [Rhodospirillales bacterium]|nr:alpha/beta hydrolase [Rhodospirillales bacterium]
MLRGFSAQRIQVAAAGGATIHVVTGGSGPPLLLLHGYPQTHVAWHALAARLSARYSLVLPDLRGYGDSLGPRPDPTHHNHCKRAMATDMVEVMAALGHHRFFLAGHDRGARVAHRLALDYPDCVTRLALLDILPTLTVWETMDWTAALQTYHWSFLAQPPPVPERLISHDPDFYLHHLLDRWAGNRALLESDAVAAYAEAFRRPSVIEATCEDYRAGATVDLDHDRADRAAGRRIASPTLLIWGRDYLTAKGTTPLAIWRDYADDVREVVFDCGHFVAEEEPDACAGALASFFGR